MRINKTTNIYFSQHLLLQGTCSFFLPKFYSYILTFLCMFCLIIHLVFRSQGHRLSTHGVKGLWIKARGLGQRCTRPAGRAPGLRPEGWVDLELVFSKWDIGNTSLCVASPEQANSHSSDTSYHGEQGYNCHSGLLFSLRRHVSVDSVTSVIGGSVEFLRGGRGEWVMV